MIQSVSKQYNRSKIHSHKFALWVAIGSIIMMFVSITSAYVVRRASGNWYEFKLPDIFFLNTLVIIASSVALQLSYNAFIKGNEKMYKSMMLTTMVLGLSFVVLQYQGWVALDAMGATFTINPSSSFVYVISGMHAAHVLGGLAALIVALIHAFSLPYKPTQRRKDRFVLVVQYWHFVDILWVYLIGFFMLQS